MAYYWLLWVGAAAYEVPALLPLVGLGRFFTPFSYLLSLPWTLVGLLLHGSADPYKSHRAFETT
jgi:hypothetical protein